MIWSPTPSVARGLETGSTGLAARLRDAGRPDFLRAAAPGLSAGAARGSAPAVGCRGVRPLDSLEALPCPWRIPPDGRSVVLAR